jgi:hypothetical protein
MTQLALREPPALLTLPAAQALADGLTQVQAQRLRDAHTPEERLRRLYQFAGYAKDMARQYPHLVWAIRLRDGQGPEDVTQALVVWEKEKQL